MARYGPLLWVGNFVRSVGVSVLAATGNSQATAAAIAGNFAPVTGADATKGVRLPSAVQGMAVLVVNTSTTSVLKVYPATGGTINALAANAAFSLAPGASATFVATSITQWYAAPNGANFSILGLSTGQKLATGVHQQVAASDTVVTGLATVVACGATWRDTPTVKQMFITTSIGNQAGAPAAGSILVKSFKPTAVNDVTPIAATDFTDNLSQNWWALGT